MDHAGNLALALSLVLALAQRQLVLANSTTDGPAFPLSATPLNSTHKLALHDPLVSYRVTRNSLLSATTCLALPA